MDKYINYKDIQECRFFQDERGEWILHADIIKIPAADVAPVAHGYWINLGKYNDGYNWRCSSCKRESVMAINYCPNCGAKMDGGQNE